MNRGDALVERGAAALEDLARNMAADGGVKAKLAEELAEDAAFLRKLKPSLIAARARGEAPTDESPARTAEEATAALRVRVRRPRREPGREGGDGPNPFLVAAVALALGIAMAKLIDWRGHAHPRR
jgi:hypothetical protein